MPALVHESKLDPKRANENAAWLSELILWLLENEMEATADVSIKACKDVIHHYHMDMVRHLGHQKNGIDSAKHVSYLSFWVRKLKPVACAFYAQDIASGVYDSRSIIGRELHDINERISLLLVRYLLRGLARNLKLAQSDLTSAQQEERVVEYFEMYMFRSSEATDKLKNNFEQYVYDMRYRTFGPHHLTNLVKHAIFHATNKAHTID